MVILKPIRCSPGFWNTVCSMVAQASHATRDGDLRATAHPSSFFCPPTLGSAVSFLLCSGKFTMVKINGFFQVEKFPQKSCERFILMLVRLITLRAPIASKIFFKKNLKTRIFCPRKGKLPHTYMQKNPAPSARYFMKFFHLCFGPPLAKNPFF